MNENVYAQVEGCLLDTLLYNPDNSTTLHLNNSSAIIWKLCDGERTVAKIIEMIQEAFPEQSDQISDDVPDVLQDLCDKGVLTLVE